MFEPLADDVGLALLQGLMLRQPKSLYKGTRNNTLLKVKSFKTDEARVVGHKGGDGKHKGLLGAYQCRMKPSMGGHEFSVGTGMKDAERRAPLAIGAVITFKYFELTKKKIPRFPSYIGERIDMTLADFERS
jgi:DNA ligase-1